jgi:EAL domain-containing protein (putative c-di-GMP-specific phosphodiesterase class I)
MLDANREKFQALVEAFNHSELSFHLAKLQGNSELAMAMINGGFESSEFEFHPVYFSDGERFREILYRPKTLEGKAISIGEVSSSIYKYAALARPFDTLVCAQAGEKAVQYCREHPDMDIRFSTNVSLYSVIFPKFWADVLPSFEGIKPQKRVWELLEHDVEGTYDEIKSADIAFLDDMRADGDEFAMDDFTGTPFDIFRMEKFGHLLRYLKFDGALVRAALGDPDTGYKRDDLKYLADWVLEKAPAIELVAERARTMQEVDVLRQMGIQGVQSHHLKYKHVLPPVSAVAKEGTSCDPDIG